VKLPLSYDEGDAIDGRQPERGFVNDFYGTLYGIRHSLTVRVARPWYSFDVVRHIPVAIKSITNNYYDYYADDENGNTTVYSPSDALSNSITVADLLCDKLTFTYPSNTLFIEEDSVSGAGRCVLIFSLPPTSLYSYPITPVAFSHSFCLSVL
jgi:hypothetical protein